MPQNQADDFEQWRAQRQPRRPADELADFARQRGATVTSTTGGQHNPGSKHYTGEAVDIRTRDRSDDEVDDLMDEAESYGYTVRDERQRPAGQGVWGGPHLHVEAPDPNDDFAQWRNQRQKQTQELQGSGWHAPQALPGTPQQPARPQTRLQSPSRAPMITRQPAPRPAPPVRPQSMQKGPVRQTSGNVDPFRWDYPQQHSMAWDMANREKKYPTSPEVAAQQKQQEEFAKQSLPRQAWEAAKQVPGRVISNLGSTAQRLETIGTGLAQGDAKPLLGTIGQLGTGAVIGTAKAAENVLGMMGDGPETPTRQRLAQERQAWERAQALARQDYETGARKYLDDPNALTFDEMRQLQARQEAEAQLTNTPTANITRAVGDALPAVALGAAGGMPAALGTQAAMGNVEQPLDTAVNMASVAVPMGLTRAARPGLNAATQAMRPLPRAVARTAGEMGIGAAGNVGQSLVTQPLLRGRIDPQQLAEDAAVGAVFGASDAAQGMHAERVAPRQLAERMRGQLDAARTFNDRLSTFNRQIDPVTDELIRRQTQPRAQTGQSNPASNLSSSHPVTTPQNAGQFQFTNDLQARVPGKLAITVTGADGKPVRALYDRGQFESRNAAEAAARKAYEQTQQPAERTRRGGQSPYVVLDESEWNNDPTPGYKQSVVKVGETEHLIEYDPKQIGVAAAGAKAKREIAEAQQRIGENQAQRAAQAMRQSARPEAPTQADNAPTFEPTPAPVETGFETNVSTRAANADQIIAEMVNRGRLPQLTEIRDRMGVTRTEAQQIQADIAAEQRAVRTQSRTERKQPLGQTQEPAAAPQTPTVEEAPQQRPRLLTGTDGRRQGVPPAQPMRPNLRPASVDRMPRRQFTETESPAPDNVVPLRRPPSPESPRRPLRLAGPSDKSADFPKEQRSLAQLGRAVEQARAAGTEDQGPFGRIARQGFKSTEADGIKGHTAFFNEPSVKGVLGLDPDASMGEVKAQFNRTFAKLLRQRDTEEVSLTQVPLDAWNAWMRRNRSLLSDEARRRFEVLKRSYQEGELAREIEKATAIDPERPEQGTSRTEAASQPVVIGAESGTRRPSATDNETAPARRGAASRPEQGLSDAARNVETNPAADFIERIIRENDGLGRDRLIRESGLTRSHIVPALNELKQQGRIEERDGALRVVTPAGGDQISNPSAESHIAVSEPPLAGLPKDKESAAAEARPRAVTEPPQGGEAIAAAEKKEPWQMRRDDFAQQSERKYIEKRGGRVSADVTLGIGMDAVKRHERFVEEALSEGHPVPESVLADYPDLAAKYGQAPEAEPETQARPQGKAAPAGPSPTAADQPAQPPISASKQDYQPLLAQPRTPQDVKSRKRQIAALMPFNIQGNKSELLAKGLDTFVERAAQASKRVIDAFAGAATYTHYLRSRGLGREGDILNEYDPLRFITHKQIKDNPRAVAHAAQRTIADLQKLTHPIKEGAPFSEEHAAIRRAVTKYFRERLDALTVPGQDLAAKARTGDIVEMRNTPETAALYTILQNQAFNFLPVQAERGAKGFKLPGFAVVGQKQGKVGVFIKGKSLVINIPTSVADASKRLQGLDIRRGDGWNLIQKQAGDGDFVPVDTSYLNKEGTETTNYNKATREDAIPDVYVRKVEENLLPAWQRGAKLMITNNWDENVASYLREQGFKVFKDYRQGAAKDEAKTGGAAELIAINYDEQTGRLIQRRGDVVSRAAAGRVGEAANQRRGPDAGAPSAKTMAGQSEGENAPVRKFADVAADVNSPAFKQWFSDSKVTDKNGSPLVVYHGTTSAPFDVFDKARIGERFGKKPQDQGFWFSASADQALTYAKEGDYDNQHKARVEPVYLSLKNPAIWGDTPGNRPLKGAFVKQAIADGHDGVIFRNLEDGTGVQADQYLVFSPEQIKQVRHFLSNKTDEDVNLAAPVQRPAAKATPAEAPAPEQPVGSVARPDFKEPDAAPGKIVELGSGLNLIQAYRDLSRLASKGGRALGRVGEAKTKPPVPQHFDMDAYLHDADKDVIKRDLPRAALPHYEDAVQKVIDAYDADDGVALMRANDKLLQVLGKYGKTDVKRTLASLGGLSRSLVFSGDFNFLRGSLNTMLRNPKQFFKQPVHGLGAFLSKDAAIEARARLHADPDWQRWLNAGMFSVTEAKHGIDFNPLNIDDSLMGHAADKIPVLKQIERANEVMIDEARLSVVKDLGEMHNAKLDRIMDGDEYYAARDRYDQQVAKFANAITGRANLATEGKAGAVVNVSSSLLTSARYMASFLDSLWQGAKLVKLEPKAAPAVATYLATRMLVTAGLTAGVNALLGQSTNTDDPRSEDFWKIKVGDNETHDFSGGSLPYWRMMTRVADIATSDSPPRAKAAQIFDVLKDFSLQRVAPVPRELTRVVLTAIGRDQKEERPLVEDGLASLAESFIPIFIQSGIETGVKYGRDEGIKAAVMSVLGDNASKYERLNRPLPALSGDTPLGREMRRLDVRQVEKDDPLSTMYNPAPYRDLRRVGKFQERPVADTIFGKGIAPVESSDSYERRISQADALWRQAGNETLNSPQYRALPDPLKAKVLGRLRGQIAAATEDERPRPVRPAQIIREVVEAAKVDSREKRERRLRPELRGLR